MGNICRSPSAEAVFRQKAQALSLVIDSAGVIGSHAREKPDHRAQKAGIARGYSFDKIKARKVTVQDFEKFDLILAMDQQNIKAKLPLQICNIKYNFFSIMLKPLMSKKCQIHTMVALKAFNLC